MAKEAWDSIQREWGRSTNMRRSHAQEALNKTTYVEGTDIQDHIKQLRTRRAAVDNLGTSIMNDETWRGIIIQSIPPTVKWLPVIPSLYAMSFLCRYYINSVCPQNDCRRKYQSKYELLKYCSSCLDDQGMHQSKL